MTYDKKVKSALVGWAIGTIVLFIIIFFAWQLTVSGYQYKQKQDFKCNCEVINGVTYDKKGRVQK